MGTNIVADSELHTGQGGSLACVDSRFTCRQKDNGDSSTINGKYRAKAHGEFCITDPALSGNKIVHVLSWFMLEGRYGSGSDKKNRGGHFWVTPV